MKWFGSKPSQPSKVDDDAFWQRMAEHDRRARIRQAQHRKNLIKEAVREVLDERERNDGR